jgi:hypothetical protein
MNAKLFLHLADASVNNIWLMNEVGIDPAAH